MLFTENRYDRSMEQMMKGIPNFYPRGSGIVVTGNFHYTAEMCDCEYCGYYGGKKKGCLVPKCVCLEERISVGVASVKEIMNETMSEIRHSGFIRRLKRYSVCFDEIYAISPQFAEQYLKIIWLDSVCYNMDRHTENFGFLRDVYTGDMACFQTISA